MNFLERYYKLVHDHHDELLQARNRLDSVDAARGRDPKLSGEVLGDSSRRDFIAAADPSVDAASLSCESLRSHMADLYAQARVVYRTKRQAIVQVGAVFCVCNRFGVSTFVLPVPDQSVIQFTQHSTPDFGFDGSILEAIGAVEDGRERGDLLYRYDLIPVQV